MENPIGPTLRRAGRVGVASTIAGVISQSTGDIKWLALTPLISALGKFLRITLGLKFIPF
jgi:hypothetical protein